MTTVHDQFTSTNEGMRLFQQERAIIEVTELICGILESDRITRVELAKRLGKTKGFVSQLLDGESNMTIRTVSDVFTALGRELRVSAPFIGSEIFEHTGRSMQFECNDWWVPQDQQFSCVVQPPEQPTFSQLAA